MNDLSSTRDLLFLVLAIATAWVAVFLCYALYNIGRLFSQSNEIVTDVRRGVDGVKSLMGIITNFLPSGGTKKKK